jgi:large repetitive protein
MEVGQQLRRGSVLAIAATLAWVWLVPVAGSTHDKTPPQTRINSGPGPRTTDTTPTFAFTSNEEPVSFVCKLDGGRFRPCATPKTLKRLRGKHGFYVKAIDSSENVDRTAAAYVFKVVRK